MKRKIDRPGRRGFLKKLSATSLGVAGLPLLSIGKSMVSSDISFPPGSTILFQGDSITDMGRDRGNYYPNEDSGMGHGYVFPIVAEILGNNPGKNLKCYNRGISGNKVYQLADRWDDDCLNLKPDVLSILIGVNDFWHTLTYGYKGTAQTYESDFRKLLDRTLKSLPDVKLIIGEPYAIKGGSAINDKWFPDFLAYQKAARSIATDYKAKFIPFQSIFDEALKSAPVTYWSPDGVHPSIAGDWLMKNAWLKTYFG